MMTTRPYSHDAAQDSLEADAAAPRSPVRKNVLAEGGLRWEDVPLKQYKEEGTHFKSITRQVLFDESSGLTNEVRYFEIQPDGHSTLERHEHVHAVIILSGRGRVMVGSQIWNVAAMDLVHVPPQTWHQFRADDDAPLGFLCLVPCDRDRPVRPSEQEAATLKSDSVVGAFVRI